MCEYESEIHHLWPVNYCTRPYKLTNIAKAKYFTYRYKKFILQCFVLKPLIAILEIVGTLLFHDSSTWHSVESFLYLIIAISVSYSLYYLILFYYALKKPLAPYNPLMKFLVIKITLFFTFWQALMIGIMED